ncbi:hypothetical protein MHBO_001151 [Bonamia ostreae]|uniref:Protein ENHANCED DISEASE RESISTANCE 2 C-terminal domain-containing protein n=1 Tax=Bonamia ostreae TaxID=126728 RepID=A0ABV2AHY3_9EUKA
MTKTYSSSLAIDLAFTLEGREEEHLPEKVFCKLRINRMSNGSAIKIEDLERENIENIDESKVSFASADNVDKRKKKHKKSSTEIFKK